jgi:hypothetical protein
VRGAFDLTFLIATTPHGMQAEHAFNRSSFAVNSSSHRRIFLCRIEAVSARKTDCKDGSVTENFWHKFDDIDINISLGQGCASSIAITQDYHPAIPDMGPR